MVILLSHPDRFDENLIVQISLNIDKVNPRKQISSPQPEIPTNDTPSIAPLQPHLDASNSHNLAKNPATMDTMPKKPARHGAPFREYMNTKVTGTLMEGMKLLAQEK